MPHICKHVTCEWDATKGAIQVHQALHHTIEPHDCNYDSAVKKCMCICLGFRR